MAQLLFITGTGYHYACYFFFFFFFLIFFSVLFNVRGCLLCEIITSNIPASVGSSPGMTDIALLWREQTQATTPPPPQPPPAPTPKNKTKTTTTTTKQQQQHTRTHARTHARTQKAETEKRRRKEEVGERRKKKKKVPPRFLLKIERFHIADDVGVAAAREKQIQTH